MISVDKYSFETRVIAVVICIDNVYSRIRVFFAKASFPQIDYFIIRLFCILRRVKGINLSVINNIHRLCFKSVRKFLYIIFVCREFDTHVTICLKN